MSKRPVSHSAIGIYEWIQDLRPEQLALDLGSGRGSFPASWFRAPVITLDEDTAAFLETDSRSVPHRLFARSHELPFADRTFDLVICHHSLEHIAPLAETLTEIARVLKPHGRVYIAIPNGYGLCDAVYRFAFNGGGHVNRFSRVGLIRLIEQKLPMHLVAWQPLYSSFIYLRRILDLAEQRPPDLSPRLSSLTRVPKQVISAAQWILYLGTRIADHLVGTALSQYGWAFYFESPGNGVLELPAYSNVCMFCGVGHPSGKLRRRFLVTFRCPNCNRISGYIAPFRNESTD